MGASTALITAGNENLPANVGGGGADCGYTSAEEIIKKVVKSMHLPVKIFYPLINLSAKIFGGFNLKDASAIDAMKNCHLPVVFFHSETDQFVPAYMSRKNYEACAGKKMLVTIPNAGHGLAYPREPETYLNALRDFFGHEASYEGPTAVPTPRTQGGTFIFITSNVFFSFNDRAVNLPRYRSYYANICFLWQYRRVCGVRLCLPTAHGRPRRAVRDLRI